MDHLERFLAEMDYKKIDRVPNWEVGVWEQTIERWESEGLPRSFSNWDWFTGAPEWGMDPREFIHLDLSMKPPFREEVIERTERYLIKRHSSGIVTKALLTGMVNGQNMSMDQHLSHPITCIADFEEMKKRYIADIPTRYEPYWKEFRLQGWKDRHHPLVLGENCHLLGFYWIMRDWMGTENLSYAFYDDPDLIHEMCRFICDYTIACVAPVLDEIAPDYMFVNEDLAMKTGPLLSPAAYREFIYPEMRRLVSYCKGKGVKYAVVDSDGNTEPVLSHMMDAGVDGIWPLERASECPDPLSLRKKYGRSLRLWGGVDKREIAKGKEHISAHLKSLIPLIEDGGYIPTVDHTVPPDISLDNFRYYMEKKDHLLRFEFDKI